MPWKKDSKRDMGGGFYLRCRCSQIPDSGKLVFLVRSGYPRPKNRPKMTKKAYFQHFSVSNDTAKTPKNPQITDFLTWKKS